MSGITTVGDLLVPHLHTDHDGTLVQTGVIRNAIHQREIQVLHELLSSYLRIHITAWGGCTIDIDKYLV